MQWQDLESFIADTSYTKAQIARLVKSGEIEVKNEEGMLYLRHRESLPSIATQMEVTPSKDPSLMMQEVLQKVLDIHSKFALAKDEMIASLKSENEFLKSTILAMQEAYMQDKQMLDFLRQEVQASKQELEEMKKKYKLMWDRVRQSQ
ncbi:DUF3972 domain-containing protein [Helicobacter pametensis]|uniref:DUF3972 domain-containing protein n=1 Tax=Helicobacter pametensis TaxID=95149 RepID=UPI0004B9ADA2|nr:DUF3972 domain-containing protein [Helicobacter pametensis]